MNIWSLPPLSVALIFFCIDYLAIIFIRIVFEKRFYLRRWWAFKYGDSLFLPLYGFNAAQILHTSEIQINFQWSVFLIIMGILCMLGTEYLHVEEGFYKPKVEFLPSQIYHAFIFVVMFYFVGSSFPVVILLHPLTWSFGGAILAIAGYLLMVYKDYTIKRTIRKSYKKRKR